MIGQSMMTTPSVLSGRITSDLSANRKLSSPVIRRLVLRSVQLAFARQDAKERGESDDAGRRSDDSYSPRRHWCSMFKPDGEAWVRGLRTDV